ncbi:MAG TPA: hypothetical protein EYP82_07295 [Hydrogenothermaceae bacterium]|nr:hypothetical protein [Hydrogenothermaceae bacterium]
MRLQLLIVLVITFSNAKSIEESMLPYMQFNQSSAEALLPGKYNYLKESIKKAGADKEPRYAILYFFSNSVPKISFSNHLVEVAKFNREHEISLKSTQSMIGINHSLKAYILGVRKHLKGLNEYDEEIDLIDIRLSPEVFERFDIISVPAIALAKCPASAHPSKCSIVSIARGDISLEYFFSLLDENNILPKELR